MNHIRPDSTIVDKHINHRLIRGLDALWATTTGSQEICVAVLDGNVDLSHPCFAGAHLEVMQTLTSAPVSRGVASAHGTHIASTIFGQHGSTVTGLAPLCRGLIVPIFSDDADERHVPCSQLDLARAITQAVERGAHIINISGGQLSSSGEADPLLHKAIALCRQRNVLIVAAAGNDGCECVHVPASVDTTLAVGAADRHGRPLDMSNWGRAYRERGIVAPGENIFGALPGGGTAFKSGTSFATSIVSAVVALLLCRQLANGERPDPRGVCSALLQSAIPCNTRNDVDCRRLLTGALNVFGALKLIDKREIVMSEANISEATESPGNAAASDHLVQPGIWAAEGIGAETGVPKMEAEYAPQTTGITASGCGCSTGAQGPSLVYALGTLNFDFGTEARRDSFTQAMPDAGNNPNVPQMMVDYLLENPYEAQSLIWTLNLDVTPIYAIVPDGAYSNIAYDRLISALQGKIAGTVEMMSVPGVITGSVRLMSGQVVPTISPSLRGIYSWAVSSMIESVLGTRPETNAELQEKYDIESAGLRSFLSRIYYDLRNLGITPADRALNYSATNAFQVAQVIESATNGRLELDTVNVKKSPICRPDSECYDVELKFFNPLNTNIANKIYRFTVDVSDIIPVTVGEVRAWSMR